MNSIREEVIQVLDVLEESVKLNCMEEEYKTQEIKETKDYILSQFSKCIENKTEEFVTTNCPSCEAIDVVNRNSNTRCTYCKSIVEDKK